MTRKGNKKQKQDVRPEGTIKALSFDIADQVSMEKLMEILRKNRKALRKFRGVIKIDIGYQWEDGRITGNLALRVHVKKKKAVGELDRSEILPDEIDGIPVDVIQSEIGLQRMARYDPLVGGIGIRNVNISCTGTLGAVVFDANGSQPMALTTRHVVAGSLPGEATGHVVNQPDTLLPEDAIGTVARCSRIYDCAVVSLNGNRKISTSVIDFPGGIKGIAHPVPGMMVAKSGRATGTTQGMVEGVSEKEFTIVPVPGHTGDEISMGGDSGSIWLEEESHAAVGLHYGGETSSLPEDERAWAKRMSGVAGVMKIRLCRKTNLNPVSSCAPSVIATDNRLLLGWSKPVTHRVRFLHSHDGTKFSGKVSPGIKSSNPVALAFFRNRFTVAWSDVNNGYIHIRFSDDGIRWTGKAGTGESSLFSPALAVSRDLLLLSWTESLTGRICLKQSADGINWLKKCIFDIHACSAPSLAVFNGKILIARSDERNQLQLMTSGDGFSIDCDQPVGYASSSPPFLHVHSNRLFLAWKGEKDQRLNILESDDGQHFHGHLVLRETSPDRPALATLKDELVWCWKRSGKRPGISVLCYNL